MIIYSIVPPRRAQAVRDDPWDADAVHYLLRAGGYGLGWSYSTLLGCLRERPAALRRLPAGLRASSVLAAEQGVEKQREHNGGREVIHLRRTDRFAPAYPVSAFERRTLIRMSQHPVDGHRLCAICGHLGVPIVYGMVSSDTAAQHDGRKVLAGCSVEPFDTQCLSCTHRWVSSEVDQHWQLDELLGLYDG